MLLVTSCWGPCDELAYNSGKGGVVINAPSYLLLGTL